MCLFPKQWSNKSSSSSTITLVGVTFKNAHFSYCTCRVKAAVKLKNLMLYILLFIFNLSSSLLITNKETTRGKNGITEVLSIWVNTAIMCFVMTSLIWVIILN